MSLSLSAASSLAASCAQADCEVALGIGDDCALLRLPAGDAAGAVHRYPGGRRTFPRALRSVLCLAQRALGSQLSVTWPPWAPTPRGLHPGADPCREADTDLAGRLRPWSVADQAGQCAIVCAWSVATPLAVRLSLTLSVFGRVAGLSQALTRAVVPARAICSASVAASAMQPGPCRWSSGQLQRPRGTDASYLLAALLGSRSRSSHLGQCAAWPGLGGAGHFRRPAGRLPGISLQASAVDAAGIEQR